MNKIIIAVILAIALVLGLAIPQARKASAQAFYATACFATGLALPGCNLVLPWPPFTIAPIRSTPAPTFAPTATPTPTSAPTATPIPTIAPTATPTPTAVPTATPTPTPTTTPVPTATPTTTPTATPTATPTPLAYTNCTLGNFSAPNNYPDVCWRPYAANSVWNMQFSDYTGGSAPSVSSSSSTWMSFYTSNASYLPLQYGFGETNAASESFGHPMYFSKSTDPTYTITCTESYASSYCPSGSYHIPSYAVPAGGYAIDYPNAGYDYNDHHFAVLDQTTNIELDCWRGMSKSGGVFTAHSCSTHSITGNGIHGFETRSGYNLWAGEIREQELIAGIIPHALFLVSPCTNNGVGSTSSSATYSVYPADQNSGTDTLCSGNQGAPYGTWFKLNVTDAQIAALSAPAYKKAVYTALAHYGAYIADNNGNNAFGFQVESDYMYTKAGYTNSNCPTNGAACTPLTAYFHQNYADAGFGGNGYVIQLNDFSFGTYGQWLNPPSQSPPSPAPTVAPTPPSSYTPGPTPTPSSAPTASPSSSPTPIANLQTYIKNLDLNTVSGMTCPGATPAPDDAGKWSCAQGLVGFADTGVKSDNSAVHINHMALVIPHVGGYMDISNGCGTNNGSGGNVCVPDMNPEHTFGATIPSTFFATTSGGARVLNNTSYSFTYNQSTAGSSGTGATCGDSPNTYTATIAQQDCTLNPVVPIPTASPVSGQSDPNLQNERYIANYEGAPSTVLTVQNSVIATGDSSYMSATGHLSSSPLNYMFGDDSWDRGDLGGYPDYYSWDNASFNSGHAFALAEMVGANYPYPTYNHASFIAGLNSVISGSSKPIIFNLSGYVPDASGSKNGVAQPAPPSSVTACGTNCLGFMQENAWNNPYQSSNQPSQGGTWASNMNALIYAQNNGKDFINLDQSGTIPAGTFTSAVATGDQTVSVSSVNGIDYGYQVTTSDNTETVTVTAVYDNSFEATFTHTHASGSTFSVASNAMDSGGLWSRKYGYASEMLAMDHPSLIFNSNGYQIDSANDAGSYIPLGIENGLIAMNPITSQPPVWSSGSATTSGIFALEDTTQASGTSYICPSMGPTTGVNCAFYREYANCYFEGAPLGSGSFHGCATVVFPAAGIYKMPTFTQTYTHTVDFTGFDLVQGLSTSGTMDTSFYGPPPAGQSIGGPRAYILTP